MVLLIDNDDVKRVLTMPNVLEALEEAYGDLADGNLVNRPRIDLSATTDMPDHIYRWGTMEAVNARTGYHALRMKSDVVYWSQHERGTTEEKYSIAPGTYCGLIFLFSAKNAEPLAIIHDGYLTHMRVGATHALGAKYLAREDAETLGMIGSGWMARIHALAFACVRPLRRLKVFSLTKEHLDQYVAEMAETLGIEVVACQDPRDAVRGADIAAACTDSITPVFFGSWVKPGMHLSCVKPKGEWDHAVEPRIDVLAGGDTPRPPLFGTSFKRGQGNFLTYAAGDPQLLAQIPRWPERKIIHEKRPRSAPLGPMIKGEVKGRRNAEEVSASSGSSVGDSSTQGLPFVALGARVYELAKQQGLGKEIPTELFVQDIRD